MMGKKLRFDLNQESDECGELLLENYRKSYAENIVLKKQVEDLQLQIMSLRLIPRVEALIKKSVETKVRENDERCN